MSWAWWQLLGDAQVLQRCHRALQPHDKQEGEGGSVIARTGS